MENLSRENVVAQQVSENFAAPRSTTRSQRNTCFSRRHLRPAVEAFYQYALSVSHASGVFFSHARRDGWEFNVSKNSVTSWIDKLETDGWLQRLDGGPRLKRSKSSGMYASIRYRVLTHDEWAAAHHGRCRFPPTESAINEPVPKTGTGQTTPRVFDAPPVPNIDTTGPNLRIPPVPKTGTKVCIKSEVKQDRASLTSTRPTSLRAAGRDLPITDHQQSKLWEEAFKLGWNKKGVLAMIGERFGVGKVCDLPQSQYQEVLLTIRAAAYGPGAWIKA